MDVATISEVKPLSPPQQEILNRCSSGQVESGVCSQLCATLHGPLDALRLQRAWECLGEHPLFRTFFVLDDGPARESVARTSEPKFRYEGWSRSPQEQWKKLTQTYAQRNREKGFDIAQRPLARLDVFRTGQSEHKVYLTYLALVFDDPTAGVLLDQLLAIYAAGDGLNTSGEVPSLGYPQLLHFVRTGNSDATKKYWLNSLSHSARPSVPMSDRVAGASKLASVEETLTFQVPPDVCSSLLHAANVMDAPLEMLMEAAMLLALEAYSPGSALVMRLVRQCTSDGNSDFFAGPVAQMLPLQIKIDRSQTGAMWIQELKLRFLDLQQNSFVVLADALQWAGQEPGAVLECPRLIPASLSASRFVARRYADFEVTEVATIREAGQSTTFEFRTVPTPKIVAGYDKHILSSALMEALVLRAASVLTAMAARPNGDLAEWMAMPHEEHERYLLWGRGEVTAPSSELVTQAFERQAKQTPEATAIVHNDSFSYAQANAYANQIARFLRRKGVKQESRVVLWAAPSCRTIAAMLGILKAGGVYVPLHPDESIERLAQIVTKVAPRCIITEEHLVEKLPSLWTELVCLDADWDEIAGEEESNIVCPASHLNLAYIIHTSGSTGSPKGVMVSHAALEHRVRDMVDSYRLRASDRALQFTTLAFDASIEEIFPLFACGGSIAIPPAASRHAPAELLDFCAANNVTLLHMTASYWEQLINEIEATHRTLPAWLRISIIGGEAVSLSRVEAWSTLNPGNSALFNAYGPTEATVTSLVAEIKATNFEDSRSIPIGKPIANTQVYVLDERMRLSPVGVSGELYIGGAGVARGYVGQAGMTAERFLPDPYAMVPGQRVYRSGDLVRWREDGELEFQGRQDEQVKIRGFRIELGEIEAVLQQDGRVGEAAVAAVGGSSGEQRLVAFVVWREGEGEGEGEGKGEDRKEQLRKHLQRRLPEYMIPAVVQEVEALPLTANGKLDRKALAGLIVTGEETESYEGPRSPVEELLANIWAQVLQRERVGIHDNFFQLGGDSILSIQVVARANQAGLRLTAKDMFDHQTIAGLATVVSTDLPSASGKVPADQSLVTGPVVLTPIQRWFLEREMPQRHHFNQTLLLRLRPPLRAQALQEALLDLVLHHDALRLSFHQQQGQWQQQNQGWPPQRQVLVRVDLSGLTEADRTVALNTAANQAQASLQLESGCLLQAVLFDPPGQQPRWLLMIIHHLAVDGVSWRILLEDLQTAYTRQAQGLAPQLPPKSTSFQRWAAGLAEFAASATVQEQLPYWLDAERQHIASLPVDGSGVEENDLQSVELVEGWLNQEETTGLLQQVPQSFASQIQEALLTALALTLCPWSHSDRVLVDLEGHGREEIMPSLDVSRTVGWFTSWFPLLLRANGTVEETLAQVGQSWRQLPQHGIGYGLLRYLSTDAGISAALAGLPQAQVSFNYLGQFDQVMTQDSFFMLAAESAGQAQSAQGTRSHLLEINGMVLRGRLRMQWTYHPGLHHRQTVERLSARFLDTLRQLVAAARSHHPNGAEHGLDDHTLSIVAASLARAERA